MKFIKILALALALSACSVDTAKREVDLTALVTQAVVQFPLVELRLKEDAGLFDEEEKILLKHIANRVLFLRAEMVRLYQSEGIDSLLVGGSLLIRYQELKAEYIKGIYIVEAKMPYMSQDAMWDIQAHINTIRLIDTATQELIKTDLGQKKALNNTLVILTLVAKVALAAGA